MFKKIIFISIGIIIPYNTSCSVPASTDVRPPMSSPSRHSALKTRFMPAGSGFSSEDETNDLLDIPSSATSPQPPALDLRIKTTDAPTSRATDPSIKGYHTNPTTESQKQQNLMIFAIKNSKNFNPTTLLIQRTCKIRTEENCNPRASRNPWVYSYTCLIDAEFAKYLLTKIDSKRSLKSSFPDLYRTYA